MPLLPLLLLLLAPLAAADETRVSVASLAVTSGEAEAWDGRAWKGISAREPFATGQKVRTHGDGLARLDFAFMAVLISPRSVFGLEPSRVLTAVLDEGRVEMRAGQAIIKLRTAEATVRGQGRVTVRREDEVTRVSVLEGRFQVQSGKGAIDLDAGQGTWVEKGRPPAAPTALPAAPRGLSPGSDPVYVPRGAPVRLSWWPTASAHRVEVFEAAGDQLVLTRDVGGAPIEVDLPGLGTYRWRVATRDAHGLESLPSPEGFVCIVDK